MAKAKTKSKDHTKYVFVQMRHDWADEFDVEGCFVTTKEAFDNDSKALEKRFKNGDFDSAEIGFGTNEYFTYDNFKILMDGISVEECSPEFATEFGKLTDGSGEVGFNIFRAYLDYDPNY